MGQKEGIMTKILLAEDNELNRDMLSRRLQKNGYEVIIALDGQEAITMASSASPDIILMDMRLPVVDGLEAIKQIKEDIKTKHIPIITLTAHAMMEDKEKAFAAGCDDFDTKPIELPRLLSKIQTLLIKEGQE